MKHLLRGAALAVIALASLSAQAPAPTPVQIDGTGGARTSETDAPAGQPPSARDGGGAARLAGGHPLGCVRCHFFSGRGFTDRRRRRRIRRRREREPRLQNERRRGRDAESAPQRSRAARTGVPPRRHPGGSRFSPPVTGFRQSTRDRDHSHETAGRSRGHQSGRRRRPRHVQAGSDHPGRKPAGRRQGLAASPGAQQAAAAGSA